MKWHLSVVRQKAVSHVQDVCESSEKKAESDPNSIYELRKEVADLKSQLTALMKQRKTTVPKKGQPKKTDLTRHRQNENCPHMTPQTQSLSLGNVFIEAGTVTLLPPVSPSATL